VERSRRDRLAGILFLFLFGFLLASLIGLDWSGYPWRGAGWLGAHNLCGPVGAVFARYSVLLLGIVGAWGVPLLFVGWGISCFAGWPGRRVVFWTVVSVSYGIVGLSFASLVGAGPREAGIAGVEISRLLRSAFGDVGTGLLLAAIAAAVGVVAVQGRWVGSAGERFEDVRSSLAGGFRRLQKRVRVAVGRIFERQGESGPAPEPKRESPKGRRRPGREEATGAGRPRKSPSKPVLEPHEPSLPGLHPELPPAGLLQEYERSGAMPDSEEQSREAERLERALADFSIKGKVTAICPGPVVTRFEFEPAPGTRVNQIVSRADDIALALKGRRPRILAPIPGKGVVGIEIANRKPQMVFLREIIESDEFSRSRARLNLALGKDVAGKPFVCALEEMPHLLIAGATGSGKSVCITAIVVSLLMRLPPDRLRLILVDPKMLELSVFNGLPHLMLPVVTERNTAVRALDWATEEMGRRYQLLADARVRNIADYNDSLGEAADGEARDVMPYLLVVVDELAELIQVMPNEIEVPIARLAQMARAVGIHLILATQRPSVDVLTGVIKANFSSRIAFQVASRVDSRTVLDCNGAESLVGKGDMLFMGPSSTEPVRVHGAFVSRSEAEAVVKFWTGSRQAPGMIDLEAEGRGGDIFPEVEDALFEQAARLVVSLGQASASLLQRRFKIGYSRAGRLIDMLERHGVVGKGEGSKPREVLLDEEGWEMRRKQIQSKAGTGADVE